MPNASVVGTTNFYVSQNIGGCESERAIITVVVSSIPVPPTTSTVTYCLNDPAAPLTANGANLLWYDDADAPTGSSTAPIPDTSALGDQVFYVSQTVNGCESLRRTLTVQIVSISPDPQVTTPVRYCLNENVSRTLSAIGDNLLWYDAATGGVGLAQAPMPDTSSVGLFNFYVSQNTTGCESNRSVITVEVVSTAMAPTAASSIIYCQNETAVPLIANGINLKWYTMATGGIGSVSAPVPQTSDAGSFTYYVSQTVDGCESSRTGIDVTVLPSPVFSLPQDGILCANTNATVLKSFTLNTGLSSSLYKFEWYEIVEGNSQMINAASLSFLEVFEPGNYGVIAEDLLTGCRSDLVVSNVAPVYPPSDFSFTVSNYFVDPTALSIEVMP
ncbi:MAG: hypothetical protein EOO46_15400, partial [Flavobacterium sp.]